MKGPGYRDGWTEGKVAVHLLQSTRYLSWRSSDGGPAGWVDAKGTESQMMDDDDARWCAVWKFVADRGEVTRADLLRDFGHLVWEDA